MEVASGGETGGVRGKDEKDKKALDSLKDIGRKAIENMGATPDGKKRRDTMVRLLKGK